jgi:predicted permease
MSRVLQDLRFAVRAFARTPAFTAVAVVTLGLGIGANTAIFSVIDAAFLRPLPYPTPDRLVEIFVERPEPDDRVLRGLAPSLEDIRDWKEYGHVFSHVAAAHVEFQKPVLDGVTPERVAVRYITEDYLGLHGVAPLFGRGIEREDFHGGASPVVLLGHGFWQRRFGGDRAIIGRSVRLNDEQAVVVGVLPRSFHPDSHIWRPLLLSADMFTGRGTGASVLGRLRAGTTIEAARRTLSDLTARLDDARGRSQAKGTRASAVRVESLYDTTTDGYRSTANILTAAFGLILLISSVNVAGLLLARGTARLPELAIRAAVGAGRVRLVRQLLTESVLLSALGGSVGVLLAWISLDLLVANIPLSLPDNSPVTLNRQVLGFAAVLSLTTGLVFGLIPAFRLSRITSVDAMARAGRAYGSPLSRRGGQVVMAIEAALAVVLLVGAGLMIRSFARIVTVDVGFDPGSFVTMEVVPIDPAQATLKHYYPALVRSLRQLPGVEAVGAVDHLPLSASYMTTTTIARGQRWSPQVHQFLPGYFEAIGFTLKQGRFPGEADAGAAAPVALLNETAAREMFPDGSAVGQFLHMGPKGRRTFEIVGVVGDVRHSGPLQGSESEVYLTWGHLFEAEPLIIVARHGRRPEGAGAQVRQVAQGLGTRVVVERVRVGSDWFADRIVTPRQRTILLSAAGALGLVLALVGVFGITAYAVARRTHEIGVRMAFGATPATVVRGVIGDSIRPVGVGATIGFVGAIMATRVIASFLFETQPTDSATFVVVGILLASAALLAAWIPARQAARVDPIVALRNE